EQAGRDMALAIKRDDLAAAAEPFLALLDEVVRAPDVILIPKPPNPLHVPIFIHRMSGQRDTPVFQSPPLRPRIRLFPPGSFSSPAFSSPAVYPYFCGIHGPGMPGTVEVKAEGPRAAAVSIVDNQFIPATVIVGVGGRVTWTNNGIGLHSVVERGGDNLPS